MTAAAGRELSRRDAAIASPGVTAVVALTGALVVTLTGIVLGNLPAPRSLRLDHGLVPATVDEVARSGALVLAAVAGLAGGRGWRRWSAVTAGLHAVGVALAWATDVGPVGLAGAVAWRGVAAAGLAVAMAATAGPGWLGRGRRWPLGLLVLAAGLAALGGVRGAVGPERVAGALADAVRTSAGVAVTTVAVLAAVVVTVADRRRLAGLHATTAGALAAAAVAGDLARWIGESRPGTVTVLAVRAALATAALATGLVTVAGDRHRRR